MASPVEVRLASATDAPTVARVLANAFADDPVMSWLLPMSTAAREKRIRRFYASELAAYGRRNKPVYLAADGKGAAMWSPPKTYKTTRSDSFRQLLPMLSIFRSQLARAGQVGPVMAAHHPAEPPHWYLYMLGTRTDSQSQGIGSAMLRLGLDAVDADHAPAYLESSNYRNVPLYERHGFRVIEEFTLPGGGPSMWPMWRDPVT